MILNNLDEIYQEVLEELSYRVGIINLKDAYQFAMFNEIVKQSKLAPYSDIVIQSLCEADNAGKVWVKKKDSGNIYQVEKGNFDNSVHTPASSAEIQKVQSKEKQPTSTKVEKPKVKLDEPTKKPTQSLSQYKPATVKATEQKINEIDKFVDSADTDTKKRADILKTNWNKFINATTREERVTAVKELANNNLIEAHAGGKKIYLSANTTLPYKHLSGDGNAITVDMNKIIKEEGIEVPMRGGAADRALADMSGKHNEAGVVAYLAPTKENLDSYKSTQNTFKSLGGDEAKFDKINKKAADAIKALLPNGSKITGAQQVGGIGKTALNALGIDPKVDPTDLILSYKDLNGKDGIIKVSAKTYTDPKNITMKNAGVGSAGATYLGDIGKSIDVSVDSIKKKYRWDNTMSDEQKAAQKKGLKQEYLQQFSQKMEELASNPKGQQQLVKMWKDVHGCGKDVYTQIINKNTGDVQIKAPNHYCEPKPPFGVKFDGVKLVINMGGKGDSYLQIDMKTEDAGSLKLLFRHITK
jgi:hypothetical protein